MPGPAHALNARGNAGRCFDLQHQVDRPHVDAELEGRGGDKTAQATCLELVLDEKALLACDRSVVRANQLVDTRCDALGQPPRVDEDDCRAVPANELEQARIDRRPDAVHAPGAVLVLSGQPGHVLHRDLDPHLHRFEPPGVDDRHVAARPAQEPANLFEGPLRGGKADPLRLDSRQLAQPLQAQCEVAAALGRGHRVDLVDDEPADGRQDLARSAGQEEKQGLGRGDEDVGGVTLHRAPHVGGRVAGPDRNGDVGRLDPQALHLVVDAHQRRAQIPVDVMGECFQRRHIEDAAPLGLGRHRL